MISKSQSFTKSQLIRNLQSTNINKIEVFEGYKKVDDIKRQLDQFLKEGSNSIVLIREK